MKKIFLPGSADDLIFKLSCWSIVLFPVILRLPIGLGYRYNVIVRAGSLILLVIPVLLQLVYITKHKIHLPDSFELYWLSSAFFTAWIIAYIRTASSVRMFDAFAMLYDLITFMIAICLLFFAYWITPPTKVYQLRFCVIYGFGLYVVLNMLLYALGIWPVYQIYLADYPAYMLSLLGISTYRVLFPMADGINGYGVLAGGILTALVFLYQGNKTVATKIIYGLVTLISLTSMLLTDSRGALIFSLLAVLMIGLFGRFHRLLFYSALVISVLPIILTAVSPGSSLVSLDFLKRPKSINTNLPQPQQNWANGNRECKLLASQSSGMLSNRPLIWHVVLEEMAQPKVIHLIGYGYRGQVVSHLSSHYACIFGSYAQSEIAPAHNAWLQTWLDLGYIGLAIALGFIYTLLKRLSILFVATGDYAFRSMQAVILYVVLVGSLEASLSPDFVELFILLCFISVVTIFKDKLTER